MRTLLSLPAYIFLSCFSFCVNAYGSAGTDSSAHPISDTSSLHNSLFETDNVLTIQLSGNISDITNDRSDEAVYRPLMLSYTDADSSLISISVEAKTRGHFRKVEGTCQYPPLLIHFPKPDSSTTGVFKEQNKLKLVMPCQGEGYVIREWLVYKIYNLITPQSFKTRLVKLTLEDTKKKKNINPFYGLLLEEEKQMAKRNNLVTVDRTMLNPGQTEHKTFLTMAVFEYMIGNTDWSVQYQQNIKLLATDSTAIPFTVPYDFDHAGLVNAPYALPAEELKMSSVRERRYRGYCTRNMKDFDEVIALYNQLKPQIYNLYTSCSLLDAKYIKATINYLDQFYTTLNNPKTLEKEFTYPCNEYGTGNIIIKGLKN